MAGSRIWDVEIRCLRAGLLADAGAPPDEVAAELARARVAATNLRAPGLIGRVERADAHGARAARVPSLGEIAVHREG